MRSRWLVAGGGLVYLVGVALLALAVHVELPGPLAAYGDPTAWWPVAVQVAAGALSFGTWRWVHRRSSRPFAVVLLGLGVATVLVLASTSYARCPDPGLSSGWSVVTRVVGLITNNYAVDMFQGCTPTGAPPLALQVARLAQLVVVLVAFTSALTALLRTQVDRIAVRFSPRVSLVLGADATSAALLPALAQDSERLSLAVVTADQASPWVGQARAAGWRVVVTDPQSEGALARLLQRPGGRHALRRLAVLAGDSTEAQRLVRTVQEAVEGRRAVYGDEPVRALVRIDEPWQAEDWRRRYLARVPEWIVDTVSENEVTARLLVGDLLERGATWLLLVGRSDLTFAVVAELAQRGREGELAGGVDLPPVTVVGQDAEEVVAEHGLAQHRFGNARLGGVTAETATPLATLVADAVPGTAVVFSGDVDPADQRLAARLGATYPELLVYSRHDEVAGIGTEPLLAQVRAFGTTLDAGQGRPVDSWERIARLVHEDYERRYPDPDKPSRRPWPELEPFFRDSNVRLVLTTLRSAVAVGRSWGASTDTATAPSAEQLDRMAEREHESWRRHLRRAGRPDHPDAVAWAELPEASREKNRAAVTDSLALLATLGYRSFDDPTATWVRLRRRGRVAAVRRSEPWTWRTSRGDLMRGAAGDWEVTDDDGVTRSVAAAVFERTHTHVEGDRWERSGEIQGRRARPGEVVHSLEGDATARADQWVLKGVAGEEWLVPDAHVQRSYDRVDAP